MLRKVFVNFIVLVSVLIFVSSSNAQTSGFIYQGKLQDGAAAANGTYQFEFKLYDAASAGNQIGQTLSGMPATVTNGIFAVNLDFGATSYDGAARYLEIGVRLNGSGQPYTLLNPRQAVTSTPYAVKSLKADEALMAANSLNLGGIPAAQYVITTDARMSDARNPLPNSPNYIQNATNQQSSSNFNISGEGKASKLTAANVNATGSFQQGGGRVLWFSSSKSGFVGLFTGPNTTGSDNMFVGWEAGNKTTTGSFNSFLGSESGKENLTGFNNSFFGAYSGRGNSTGANNAFFGANAGSSSNGSFNAFFGSNSGFSNASGFDNSFFGSGSGLNNTSGSGNSFFGRSAGESVTWGPNNSFFGAYAGENTTGGGAANAYFGAFAGQKNTTGALNVFVGVNAGKENFDGSSNTFVGANSGQNQGASGNNNTALGANAKVGLALTNATAIGANAFAGQSNTIVLGTSATKTIITGDLEVKKQTVFNDAVSVNGSVSTGSLSASSLNVGGGKLVVPTGNGEVTMNDSLIINNGNISAGGATFGSTKVYSLAFNLLGGGAYDYLCYNETDDQNPLSVKNLAKCSSSRRYKENIEDYTPGVALIKNLRPVTFDWKTSKKHDVGFVAEEVAEVEPLLATYNADGQVEGVKYAQVTTALVNAVKEQQTQIERQQEQIKAQQAQIDALRALVCQSNPNAAVCQPK